MNTEVERRESVGETVAPDFQRRYARTILDLEELNTELNSLLVKVRQQCHEVFCYFSIWNSHINNSVEFLSFRLLRIQSMVYPH